MATNSLRGVLLRSLPVLLLLLTLGLTAPQTTTQALTSAGVGHSASATPDSIADTPADEAEKALSRTPEGPVADRTRALTAQRAAAVTGSRAPPLVLA
ncbi:hypothetical protein [Paractinoplanes brasiliensis]|uniref:Uncharacterized protein n=1 Tax=Paractinoplanes brasiliensis TaxID=52695 RepID=A0A4R6JPI6_9ACTN|nr:hypothetical protein [Actinoplanes brasiliensis]TDO38374.1 hypothetical protein C8E87_2027 [Actinoplanes brasiliensis]GID26849.1 hypothetical protein Abr02nite_18320 [Actinoplanes brasiliensis]